MSADLDDGPERNIASRLKRRRAREEGQDGLPADGSAEFGYGGWTVNLDSLRLPEPPRQTVTYRDEPPEPRAARPAEAPRPAAPPPPPPAAAPAPDPVPAPEDRLLPRRPEPGRRAPTPDASRAAEDRPIIAPAPPPRRRTMPEAPSRVDGPRLSPRDRAADAEGARHRRSQRIQGGGTVMIDDALYPLFDWSTGGIAIRSEGHLYRIGDRRLLELEIDLDDYAVNLDLEGEVANRSSDRTGWRFVSPIETQRQVLRALTQASLGSGAAFPPARQVRRSAPVPRARRRRPSLVAALMSLPFNAAVILIAAGILIVALNGGHLPEIDPDRIAAAFGGGEAAEPVPAGPVTAEYAAVAVERVALTAPATGIVLEWAKEPGQSVARGEPVVSLAVGEGDTARSDAVLSPCACVVARVLARAGETVSAGGDLALLYQEGVDAHVQALFRAGTAPNPGDRVTVTLKFSGEVHDGIVERVGRLDDPGDFIGLPASVFAGHPQSVFADIRTVPGLSPALAGDPAEVTVAPDS